MRRWPPGVGLVSAVALARGSCGPQDVHAWRMPASSLHVERGSTALELRYAPKAIPYKWWIFRVDLQNVLASRTGAGFLEETVPTAP
jgi:hypothetical protein